MKNQNEAANRTHRAGTLGLNFETPGYSHFISSGWGRATQGFN